MKKRSSRKDLLPLCGDVHPEDGTDPRSRVSSGGGDRRPARTAALCHHVRRVLSLVLAGECGDERLAGLEVVAVEPDRGGRLLVTVRPTLGADESGEILARLEAIRPFLRQQVAATLRRRRALDFAFRLAPAEEGPS